MILIKVGGGATINLQAVAQDLAQLGEQCIVVHGANALRDNLLERLGQEKKTLTSVSGYSSVYTDNDAIDAMLMAYSGLQNKRFVEACNTHGMKAVGLTGLDGGLIRGERTKGIRCREGEKVRIVRDLTGKPRQVNTELLHLLVDSGYTPVLTVPISDEKGFAVNTENDEVVALLQKELSISTVIQLVEAPGILRDFSDSSSVIDTMNFSEFVAFESSVEGRMKRKLYALSKMIASGVTKIVIADGRVENPISSALSGSGTVIS